MKYLLPILFTITLAFQLHAQQGISINNNEAAPDQSAIMDLQSTSKGFLCPRLTVGQRNAMQSPALGLLIYQTNGTTGFYYYDGLVWQLLGNSGGFVSACQMTATTTVTDVTTHGGSDGTATTTPVGGTAPFSYQWNGIASSQNIATATGLTAGTYCVTLTDDNACTFTDCAITITEPPVPTLGGTGPAGGIIFYLDGLGGGLECAASDQHSGAEWGCHGISFCCANVTAVGTGLQNTTTIVAQGCSPLVSGNPIAADLCNSLTLGGYSDWFLPSQDELALMYTNLHLNSLGSFYGINYWTSSQLNHAQGYYKDFNNGYQGYIDKYRQFNVRAIRAF